MFNSRYFEASSNNATPPPSMTRHGGGGQLVRGQDRQRSTRTGACVAGKEAFVTSTTELKRFVVLPRISADTAPLLLPQQSLGGSMLMIASRSCLIRCRDETGKLFYALFDE